MAAICLGARQNAPDLSTRSLLADYARGDYAGVEARLRALLGPASTSSLGRFTDSLVRETRDLAGDSTAEGDRRRLVAAALGIEAAGLVFFSADQSEITNIVDWGCGLLGLNRVPSPAEREWHRAALVLLHVRAWADLAEEHADDALKRFPGDPHFVLARATAAELRTFPDPRDGRKLTDRNQALANDIISRLTEAAKHESVRAEAELRLGFVLQRSGDLEPALTHLQSASRLSTDPAVKSLAHLFTGRTLDRLGRTEEAITAYRQAVEAMPSGQTAGLALAAALAKTGARADAARAAADSLASLDPAEDPWIGYGQGEVRQWAQIIGSLREALR
jgi:tetratricopeptide (TPR) repeat protein